MSTPSPQNYVNGQGQVSADNLNTVFQTCTNMAQLRAFAGNNSAISMFVRGTNTANDGGQGTFYWNAGTTGTDDNGVTTVVPNGVIIGCWTRQTVGTILLATSATSNTIGTGAKTFVVNQSFAPLIPGSYVIIVSRANVANYMHGQITSYSGNTLIVNEIDTGGSGTFSDWNIILSGTQGSSGATPSFSTITNGTNITAAMVVGSGASLSPTGTGTVQANTLSSSVTSHTTYNGSQNGAITVLTDGSTITPDFSLANNFSVQLGGNRTLANPTSITQGQSGQISIYQDATGSRTLAYGWGWVFPGGVVPIVSSLPLYKDELCYDVQVYGTSTVTITIASPGVVSWTAHGLRSGDRIQLATTGALPTGLAVNTTYWVVFIDANSFSLASSLANAAAGTKITTSGTQSGVQTATAITINANLVKAFS